MIGVFDYLTVCKATGGKMLCCCTKEHRYIYKYGNTMVEALLRIILEQLEQVEEENYETVQLKAYLKKEE